MMDDGKTLGRRIMIEATICKDAPAGSVMSRKAWTDLRSLCATADACERLAKAADNVSAAGDSEGASLSVEYHRALAAYREAVTRG